MRLSLVRVALAGLTAAWSVTAHAGTVTAPAVRPPVAIHELDRTSVFYSGVRPASIVRKDVAQPLALRWANPTIFLDALRHGYASNAGFSWENYSGQLERLQSDRVNTPLGLVDFGKEQVPPMVEPEALLSDVRGARRFLRDRGVNILIDNTNETAGVMNTPTPGYGYARGFTNAGQMGFLTNIDWEKAVGLTGLSTHTAMISRYGTTATRLFGDKLSQSQEIAGSGGNVVVHLVYFYGEETLGHGRFDMVFGRIPLLLDFMASFPVTCTFMNNAFCGNPNAIADNTTHSSWPIASWADRIRIRPIKSLYLQFGAYLSQKGAYGNTQFRTGFKMNGADTSGVAVPIEAGWEPFIGTEKLPGHYKIGYIRDTADHRDNYFDGNGNSYALTGEPQRVDHGSWTGYVQVDQMIYRHPYGHPNAAITLFGNFVANSENTQQRAQQYEAGIIDHGFWKFRPDDGVGLAFAYDRVSGKLGHTQGLQAMLGQPLAGGATSVQTYAMVIEAVYQIHVFRGLVVSPSFQYFVHPNGQTDLRDACVTGFRTHLEIW